jgi:RNA polymerase sigma factor (sigma-70 family)
MAPVSATATSAMANGKIAFVETLFAQHRRALREYIYRRIGTKSDASDLAQEVYVRMLRVKDTDQIRDPQRYLYSVASNLVKEHALLDRHNAQCVDIDEHHVQQALGSLPSLDDAVDLDLRSERLRAALERLPVRWRTALILQYRYEQSYEQIAAHLGVSISMVKKYLAQALAHCRRQLVQAE